MDIYRHLLQSYHPPRQAKLQTDCTEFDWHQTVAI